MVIRYTLREYDRTEVRRFYERPDSIDASEISSCFDNASCSESFFATEAEARSAITSEVYTFCETEAYGRGKLLLASGYELYREELDGDDDVIECEMIDGSSLPETLRFWNRDYKLYSGFNACYEIVPLLDLEERITELTNGGHEYAIKDLDYRCENTDITWEPGVRSAELEETITVADLPDGIREEYERQSEDIDETERVWVIKVIDEDDFEVRYYVPESWQ